VQQVRDFERFARSRPPIECAQCGERIFMPEWSEWVDSSQIRHLWRCEACDYCFETTVRYAAVA
jgi:DNA-directed RNA polymerase subunit RPC12/RpoP